MFSNTYHLSAKVFNRQTSSSAASLAYRVGISLIDPHDGLKKYPHRDKKEIQSHFVMNWAAPGRTAGTPELYQEILGEIGRTEKRINSRFFREYEIALPQEGDDEQRDALSERFGGALSRGFGITVIVANHWPPDKATSNYHSHVLGLLRRVDRSNGSPTLAEKVRKLDSRKTIRVIRRLWQAMVNRYYRDLGIDKTVSCESYETLGIEKVPTIHEGPSSRLKNGERQLINKDIRRENLTYDPTIKERYTETKESRKKLEKMKAEQAALRQQEEALKNKIRNDLKTATLNSRQKKQVSTIKQLVVDALDTGGTPLEISERLKVGLKRGEIGRGAFHRLRRSLPPAGGDKEIQDARDGVYLLDLLFERTDDDALKKLRRWAEGEVEVKTVKSTDLDDLLFLKRVHYWERDGENDPSLPEKKKGDPEHW